MPDGSPLRDWSGSVVATVRAAEIQYVDDAAYLTACGNGYGHRGRVDAVARYIENCLVALAHKNGTDVEMERARLAKKVAARVRRDYPGYVRTAA